MPKFTHSMAAQRLAHDWKFFCTSLVHMVSKSRCCSARRVAFLLCVIHALMHNSRLPNQHHETLTLPLKRHATARFSVVLLTASPSHALTRDLPLHHHRGLLITGSHTLGVVICTLQDAEAALIALAKQRGCDVGVALPAAVAAADLLAAALAAPHHDGQQPRPASHAPVRDLHPDSRPTRHHDPPGHRTRQGAADGCARGHQLAAAHCASSHTAVESSTPQRHPHSRAGGCASIPPPFTPQSLAGSVYALASLGVRHRPFLRAALPLLHAHVDALQPSAATNLLVACARLDYRPTGLVRALLMRLVLWAQRNVARLAGEMGLRDDGLSTTGHESDNGEASGARQVTRPGAAMQDGDGVGGRTRGYVCADGSEARAGAVSRARAAMRLQADLNTQRAARMAEAPAADAAADDLPDFASVNAAWVQRTADDGGALVRCQLWGAARGGAAEDTRPWEARLRRFMRDTREALGRPAAGALDVESHQRSTDHESRSVPAQSKHVVESDAKQRLQAQRGSFDEAVRPLCRSRNAAAAASTGRTGGSHTRRRVAAALGSAQGAAAQRLRGLGLGQREGALNGTPARDRRPAHGTAHDSGIVRAASASSLERAEARAPATGPAPLSRDARLCTRSAALHLRHQRAPPRTVLRCRRRQNSRVTSRQPQLQAPTAAALRTPPKLHLADPMRLLAEQLNQQHHPHPPSLAQRRARPYTRGPRARSARLLTLPASCGHARCSASAPQTSFGRLRPSCSGAASRAASCPSGRCRRCSWRGATSSCAAGCAAVDRACVLHAQVPCAAWPTWLRTLLGAC